MTKKALTYFSVICLVFICITSNLCAEKIEISTINYPPLFQSEAYPGGGHGISCDITVAAFKEVGVEVEYKFIPLARCVYSIVKKQNPANLGTINWFQKENKLDLVQGVNLFTAKILFFYKKKKYPQGTTYDDLSDMKKYKIGNIRGSATTPLVEKAGLNIDWANDLEQNIKKLNGNRFDFAIAVDSAGWAMIETLFPDKLDEFGTIDKPILTLPISLIFHKDQSELLTQYKTGLEKIVKNGNFIKIMEKYYGKDRVSDDIFSNEIKALMD